VFVIEQEIFNHRVILNTQVVWLSAIGDGKATLGQNFATMAGHLNGTLEQNTVVFLVSVRLKVEVVAASNYITIPPRILNGLDEVIIVFGVRKIFDDISYFHNRSPEYHA
jgi:hypothetical protein